MKKEHNIIGKKTEILEILKKLFFFINIELDLLFLIVLLMETI